MKFNEIKDLELIKCSSYSVCSRTRSAISRLWWASAWVENDLTRSRYDSGRNRQLARFEVAARRESNDSLRPVSHFLGTSSTLQYTVPICSQRVIPACFCASIVPILQQTASSPAEWRPGTPLRKRERAGAARPRATFELATGVSRRRPLPASPPSMVGSR